MKSGLSGGATRSLTMEVLEAFIKREFRAEPRELRCGTEARPHAIGPRWTIGGMAHGHCVRCGMTVPISRWP